MTLSLRQRVVDFLADNVVGRTVVAPAIVTRTNEASTRTTYAQQTFFSNLARTPGGFDFDVTSVTTGHRYVQEAREGSLDAAGTMDAVRVYRYEMWERLSTGRLTGFGRLVSSTNTQSDPMLGTCFFVQMHLDDGDLIVEEAQVGYGDAIATDGDRTPKAFDGRYRYKCRDGRLEVHFAQASFDVDPITLARIPTHDEFPVQVSEEFDALG